MTHRPTDFTPGVGFAKMAMCALVLEDDPVGKDSKLDFESFPMDGIEESYAVAGYREIAADRMPQPGFAAYRGGNWSAFNLELKFRAGSTLGREVNIRELAVTDLESILTQMERKARWCQALCFPLQREATALKERILSNARAVGFSEQDLQGVNRSQFPRHDPPYVLVQFGSWMTLRCYATGYSIKWEHPFHPITVQPYGATVTLSLQRLDLDYPTWKTVRNQAGGLPQSPFLPRLPGVLVFTAAGILAGNNAAANAAAAAEARARNPGAAAAAFLSVGGG